MRERNKDQFTGKMFRRLWGPSLVSALGLAFGDMADAVVVGQKMGATGLAAISLCLPVYMVINVCMHSLGLGGSVRYSRYMGEGKREEAVHNFNRILQVALALGILLGVLGNVFLQPILAMLGTTPGDGALYAASGEYARIIIMGIPAFFISYIMNYYLRNDDNQKLASLGFTIANILDVLLNILFVLVLNLGVSGAALSTVLGQFIAIAIYLPGILKKQNGLRFCLCGMDLKEVWQCFRTGFSTAVQYICQLVFLLICNHGLMNLAGEEGVAVFDMLQNASYLILYLYEGTVKAMQPLISTYCGERNMEGERNAFRMGLVYGSAVGVAAILLVCIFPQAMCSFFGLKATGVVALGSRALRIYSIGTFFGGFAILIEGYYQSREMEKNAFTMTVLRSAVILIPCAMLFSVTGILHFWWLFPVTEVVSLILFFVWKKFRGEKEKIFDRERVYGKTIENKNEDLGTLTGEAEEFCEKWEADVKQSYFVTMAVEEICLAIMQKAFDGRQQGYIQVTLVALEDGQFELHIRDNATYFNPFSMDTKKWNKSGDYDMDAMGMLIIRQKAKDFFYRQYQGFNSLVVKV